MISKNIHPAFNNKNLECSFDVMEFKKKQLPFESGGVYQIRNTENNKVYIGSTADFSHRFTSHRSSLNNNKNVSKLQHDWNSYGDKKPFVFEILKSIEWADREFLYNIEQVYFDIYEPHIYGYNSYELSEREERYKYKQKRINNIQMTKDVEIHRYNCLTYLSINDSDKIEVDFQYKENKMTTFVHEKLINLFSIYPIFHRAVIDHFISKHECTKRKVKVIAWTIYLSDDDWPMFRIRWKDDIGRDIKLDMPYGKLKEYSVTLELSYYEVFKLALLNDERISEFHQLHIKEKVRKDTSR